MFKAIFVSAFISCIESKILSLLILVPATPIIAFPVFLSTNTEVLNPVLVSLKVSLYSRLGGKLSLFLPV